MRNGYVINVTAVDRPGIVAGVSSAIVKLQGNIESCSQTVLDGYFTLIMTFSTPNELDVDAVKDQILQEKGLENCQAILFPARPSDSRRLEPSQNLFVITAFGADCEGIVSQFTRYLESKEINIIDLYAYITEDGEFVLICQVEFGLQLDVKNIQYDLEALGEQVGFTVRI